MNSEDQPINITTHGDFSPGIVHGDYVVKFGSRKPRSEPPFILPQQNTSHFVGRLDQLEKLEEMLLQPKTRKMAGIVGVAGTGGIGKSALACYFAEKHRDKFPDGVIGIRVNNKDVDNIAREFARLDGEILDEDDARSASAIMQDVFASKRVLLIIDNAEIADIRELHPGGTECAIIITTRDRSLPGQIDIPDDQLIDLPVLPSPEAIALLAQFIDQHKIDEESVAINHILRLVGNLPLALEIVGKTLRNRLRRNPNFEIAQYAEALNLDRLKLRLDKHLNVRLCFYQSIRYLEDDDRTDLINAFARLSVCANSGFALHTAKAAMGEDDDFTALENLHELVDLSLLNNAQTDSQRFIFHPLLQEFSNELAMERNLLEQAKQRHAEYFINRVNSEVSDELEADLDDIINVAEWMAKTKNDNYVNYWLSLRILFNRLGHWHRANQIIDVFLKLSEENENWIAVAQFQIQQAKFSLLQGEFLKSEKTLNSIESVIHRIEPLLDQQRVNAMRLNTLGGVYQRLGKFDAAVQTLQQSYRFWVTLGDERGQAMVLNSLGGVYQRQGKFDDAVQAFQQSYGISSHLKDVRMIAMVLNSLGGVYQRQGKFDDAVQAFQQSYGISSHLKDARMIAMVLNSLGGVYQRQGQFDDAVQAFQQSAKIGRDIGDHRHLAMVLNSLGGAYQRQGQFDDAVQAFQQSYQLLVKVEDERGQAMVLNSLGGVYQRQGQFDDAVQAFQQSLAIRENLGNQLDVAMVLNSLGGVYQRQGKFDDAVQAFQQSYDISNKLDDERSLAMVLNSLGGVYQRQGKFDDAVQAFQQSAQIGRDIGDNRHLAMVLNSLGGVYQRQGKFDEAVQAFKQSAEIEQKNNNQRGQAMVLNSLGGVYQRQGRIHDAVQTFKQSLEIERKIKNQRGQAMVLNSLGSTYQCQGKFDEAVQAFQESHGLLLKLRDQRGQAMVSTSWGRVLLEKGMTEQAIMHLKEGFAIDERLKNKRGLGIVAPILCRALQRAGQGNEAILICERALKVSPHGDRLLQLKSQLEARSSSPEILEKKGVIKRILRKETGFLFGFISPDDSSADIYFGQDQIARDLLPIFAEGLAVVAEIEITERGPRAKRVRRDNG